MTTAAVSIDERVETAEMRGVGSCITRIAAPHRSDNHQDERLQAYVLNWHDAASDSTHAERPPLTPGGPPHLQNHTMLRASPLSHSYTRPLRAPVHHVQRKQRDQRYQGDSAEGADGLGFIIDRYNHGLLQPVGRSQLRGVRG